jgi:TonB family protein
MEIYSDAEKAAHKALALSTHPEQQRLAWSVLGTSYYNRTPMDASPGLLESNMTKAEEAFRRAHELDGGATESIRWNLASALEWLGREGEAADLFSDRGSPWRGGAAASESSSSGTTAPLFVQGEVRKPVVIERVQPVYSLRARHQRIEGAVILETIIGTDGRVADVRVLKGLRGLTMAAIRCLRQWRFEPARRDGEPVPVYFTVTVNFQLPPGAGARPPG